MLTQLYTDDYGDKFPTANSGAPNSIYNDWWGSAICGANNELFQVFHDPALQGQVSYNGTTWTWNFDFNLVSYGYNSYFLDCAANPPGTDAVNIGGFSYGSARNFKRGSILHSSDCLVFGDKQPKPNNQGAAALTASGSLQGQGLHESSQQQFSTVRRRRYPPSQRRQMAQWSGQCRFCGCPRRIAKGH